MEKKVYADIILVLKEVLDILRQREEKDVLELRDLSNHTIHNASVFQDEDSISTAILIYTLYKIIKGPPQLDDVSYARIFNQLNQAYSALKSDDINLYKKNIKVLFSDLTKINKKISLYVNEIVEIAKIKKGVRLFEHGISLKRVASLLNISPWDLQQGIGERKMPEPHSNELMLHRIKTARLLFK